MNPILSFFLTFILPIVIFIAIGPLMSRALLKKLGFHQEGLALRYLKIQGQWEDHLHMAKLADDPENPMPKPQS